MLIVRKQTGQIDASSRGCRSIRTGVRDVHARLMPTDRNLLCDRFIVSNQNTGGSYHHRVPEQCFVVERCPVAETKLIGLKGSCDEVPLILANGFGNGGEVVAERAALSLFGGGRGVWCLARCLRL